MDAETPAELRRPDLSQADIRSIFYGLMLAMFLSALEATIVATALPTIGRELGDAEHLPWVVTAYLLAATAVTPLYGKFADMHGRRVTLLSAIAIFILGSIGCALAPSLPLLAAARAVQGLGGGGLIAIAQTIIGDLVTPRERGRYQGYLGTVFASASVLGPVLGGFLSESFHWTWIFWLNLPLGLLTFLLVNNRLKLLPRHDRRHRLDILGAGLMIGATSTLMLALSWGGIAYGWASAPVLGLFAASALLWLGFGFRLGTAREPLIPVAVLADRVVALGTAAGALTMGTYVGLTVLVPLFFEGALGLSARESGLALIPMMVGVPLGATLSGRLMASVVHYKRVPLAGCTVAILAISGLAYLAGRGPLWSVEILLGIAAFGLGTIFPVTTVAVQNAVAPQHLGTATASMNFLRQLSAAVVVAIFGAVAFGGMAVDLHGAAAPRQISADSFRMVLAIAATAFAAALAALALMEERPFRDRPGLAPKRPLD
ncbi:MDR family MFS transporter [Enterovirga sp.]|jgi:EmrB/QacA subfamily drug resistance transporter|uniref:MDR family MFS transporter n=1 Tax=Enterovirga sp. TaxID=2026350 RepID=UPI00260AD1A7|nr:MDR family MFS transporter [Enterovirga sp.]MDB5592468.1 transporter [Enterovirga sp.]